MYNEIIDEIKKNLSGNKELDKQYLVSQMELYTNHEYGKEIIKEISRMIWDCLTLEQQEEFIKISNEENPVKDILNEVSYYLQNGEDKKALKRLDEFFKSFQPIFEDDKINEYHSFENPIEEFLFRQYMTSEKEIRYIPDDQPYEDLYYIYGFLLIESKRLDDAEYYLKKALKINPVSTRNLFELSEIYKRHTPTLNKFFLYSTEALKYAYTSQDLARAYRNLGFFYIEENQLDIAIALFNYSLKYEEGIMAYSEIEYIKSKGYYGEINFELIRDKNIQIGVNPKILQLLNQLINDCETQNLIHQELYFLNIIHDLTKEESILDKIEDIRKINNI